MKTDRIVFLFIITAMLIYVNTLYSVKLVPETVESDRGGFAENIIELSKNLKTKCEEEKNNNLSITKLYTFENGVQNPVIDEKFSNLVNGKIEIDDNCNLRMNVRNDKVKAVKGFIDFNITITELSDEFIENLEFYYLGDSLIEGQGNNYRGISHYMTELYNTKTSKDYSKSMSLLSRPNGALTIQEQFDKIVDRLLVSSEYSEETVVVFDGGANDSYYSNVYGISFDGTGSVNNDYITALKHSFDLLLDAQNKRQVNHPIIFMLPYGKYGKELLSSITNHASNYLENDNILVLDLNEIFIDEDIYPDGIHIQESGYKKIVVQIYEMLEDYYVER